MRLVPLAADLYYPYLAEAKEHLGDLFGRVATEGEIILITEDDRPLAKIVPAEEDEPGQPAGFEGWLEDDDPFFTIIEEIVECRAEHRPRAWEPTSPHQRVS